MIREYYSSICVMSPSLTPAAGEEVLLEVGYVIINGTWFIRHPRAAYLSERGAIAEYAVPRTTFYAAECVAQGHPGGCCPRSPKQIKWVWWKVISMFGSC